jgi:hypothetical protein
MTTTYSSDNVFRRADFWAGLSLLHKLRRTAEGTRSRWSNNRGDNSPTFLPTLRPVRLSLPDGRRELSVPGLRRQSRPIHGNPRTLLP